MNKNVDTRLKSIFGDTLRDVLNQALVSVKYNDLRDKADGEILSKKDDIHVIVEATVEFESGELASFTWLSHEGWPQYVLGSFKKVQYQNKQDFDVSASPCWSNKVGKKLTAYQVYGYSENEQIIQTGIFKKQKETFVNEPHLLKLNFEGIEVAFANFSYEEDWKPRFILGDDLWVFFDKEKIKKLIEKFDLEMIYDDS